MILNGGETSNYQNIVNNPYIAIWFFNKRFEIFFNDVLKQEWNLENWWYRFEWQYRGNVHVYRIGKRRNAPVIEWEKMKEDVNVMNEVMQYLNTIVTTVNPELNISISDWHPCQKGSNELYND
jgi:hypothetical protein